MAFQQSTLTFNDAQTRVAQSAALQGNTDLLTRAGQAVQFAFQHWNNVQAWPYLLKVGTGINVVPTVQDYALPSDFKEVYDVRLTALNRTLQYLPRRQYDRAVWNQTAQNDPTHYTLYLSGLDTGQITLIGIPSNSDVLVLRYYRRMSMPVQSNDVLDIPQDYENYILALAKSFFLIDVGAPSERVAFWQGMAKEGIQIAKGSEQRIPDSDPTLLPGISVLPFPTLTYPADYAYPVD
jgi:hypothetical protein